MRRLLARGAVRSGRPSRLRLRRPRPALVLVLGPGEVRSRSRAVLPEVAAEGRKRRRARNEFLDGVYVAMALRGLVCCSFETLKDTRYEWQTKHGGVCHRQSSWEHFDAINYLEKIES
jgi:hypothetical protein